MLPGGTLWTTFCEVNRDLRELARADLKTRECLKKAWAPFMH